MKKIIVYLNVTILVGIVIFLLINVFSVKKEVEDYGEVGEIEGYLTVDSIGLINAQVRQGINKATLENGIGKFDNSKDEQSYNGNICLVSHSTGEKESFFYNLKNIQIGDLIVYDTNSEKENYVVQEIDMLPVSDESRFKATNQDIITLVTKIESTNMNLIVQGYKLKN